MRAWRGAHALLLRDFDTPAPLALVEERPAGRVLRSWYLTRWEEQDEVAGSAADPTLSRLREAGICCSETEPPRISLRKGNHGWMLVDPEALVFGR
jgi:hypothetical protein